MRKYLLPKDGQFYKTQLHTHTTVSDGDCTPEEAKKKYKENGYQVVAFTDHDLMVPHPELRDENFLPLTGCETFIYSKDEAPCIQYRKEYHLNIISKDESKRIFDTFDAEYCMEYLRKNDLAYGEMLEHTYKRGTGITAAQKLIDDASKCGDLVIYNHPAWSLHEKENYSGLRGLWGVEVFNAGTYCDRYGYKPDTTVPFDTLVREGQPVMPVCSDDAHHRDEYAGGFMMVKAMRLEYDDIFTALKNGDCYASNGPLIKELYYDSETDRVHIETSEAVSIAAFSDARSGLAWGEMNPSRVPDATPITSADFECTSHYRYVRDTFTPEMCARPLEEMYYRFEVTDKFGRKAYTRPYYFKEYYK